MEQKNRQEWIVPHGDDVPNEPPHVKPLLPQCPQAPTRRVHRWQNGPLARLRLYRTADDAGGGLGTIGKPRGSQSS